MNWKRILRSCLCLIVVCCIILNVSPIKAEAVYMGGVADLGLSLGAWFLLQAAGVFFGEATEPLLNSLGDSFSSSLTSWGAANGKVDSVRDFLALVALNGVSPADKKVIIVPEDIMAGVVQWVLAVASLGVDVEVPSYSTGSSYSSSWPAIPDGIFPVIRILSCSSGPLLVLMRLSGSFTPIVLFLIWVITTKRGIILPVLFLLTQVILIPCFRMTLDPSPGAIAGRIE